MSTPRSVLELAKKLGAKMVDVKFVICSGPGSISVVPSAN